MKIVGTMSYENKSERKCWKGEEYKANGEAEKQLLAISFLESPGNLSGPKSYFEIRVSRKVRCALTSNKVHFVSLTDNLNL